MNRSEFIIATFLVLLLAFMLGWFAHWLLTRFARVGQGEMTELDRLAADLHDAELARDEAIAWYQDRETAMSRQLAQTEAELAAAMDGLRSARAEAESLRSYVEAASQPDRQPES